jgi:response regulator RpfG family c-di-GMP phosphodiesterase
MNMATAAEPSVEVVPSERQPAAASPDGAPWTVLCVDDEPNILSSLRRVFRGAGYRVLIAGSGAEALELCTHERIHLIISDMRMPGIDGSQLLERVREGWPAVTRMLLTGYADMASTIAAINRGQIYRYITKPWNDDEVLLAVRHAFERQRLEHETRRLEALTAAQNLELKQLNATLEDKVVERTQALSQANEQLKKNYLTSIKAFSNLIELRGGGQMMGHSRRVADMARRTALALGMDELQAKDVLVAGLLHDIGQIGFSDELLGRTVPRMSAEEAAQFRQHPVLGEQALMALEEMQPVATLIRGHHERWDGLGFPDGLRGEEIALGARILAVADTYDDLQTGHLGTAGVTAAEARMLLARGRGTQFDAAVLDAFLQVANPSVPAAVCSQNTVGTAELKPGMVLSRELVSREGVVLLSAEHVLTVDMIRRITDYERRERFTLALHIPPAGRR